jgi:hypothetical protein
MFERMSLGWRVMNIPTESYREVVLVRDVWGRVST